MNKFGSLFGVAILALASLPVNAALIVYTDRTAWELGSAKFGSFVTETFDSAIASSKSITFDSGIVSAASSSTKLLNAVGPLPSPISPPFQLEAYYGRVDKPVTTTWTFPDQVWGFFGDFGGLEGYQLNVSVGDMTFPPISSDGGWGVLAESNTDLFSEVAWSSGVGQSFTIDNFSYVGTDPVSPVPAPAALWLFGTGLLGLIGFSWRRKAA